MSVTTGLTKEDLHFIMAELQKKLKDSEEERKVLEKTCEILIKAFKDEQRMYYNALSNKYEKFLEDCNIRRRRNDVILRSLSKVEDKAKAIFAKTEKLKLLKDRYILYLKQNEFLKDPKGRSLVKNSVKIDPESKSVHWKTPVADSLECKENVANSNEENQPPLLLSKNKVLESILLRLKETSLEKNYLLELPSDKAIQDNLNQNLLNTSNNKIVPEVQRFEELKLAPLYSNLYITPNLSDKNTSHIQPPFEYREFEKSVNEIKQADSTGNKESTENLKILKDFGHKESKENEIIFDENVVNVIADLSIHKNGQNEKEKENFNYYDTGHQVEETKKLNDNLPASQKDLIKNDQKCLNPAPIWNENDTINKNLANDENWTNSEVTYLKGLDGVDYQNETYPESYYEQPVRHNHFSSLASKVILEEDEFELEQEEKENTDSKFGAITQSASIQSSPPVFDKKNSIANEDSELQMQIKMESPFENEINTDKEIQENKNFHLINYDNQIELSKLSEDDKSQSQGSHDKKFLADKEFPIQENDSKSTDDSLKLNSLDECEKTNDLKKNSCKSNLMILLESDSESFQIEHGEMVSGCDDSDFDFSFKQNPE